ncbi:MAG: hypothetical protein QOF28_1134 [Actinomycetota bacterium]|nr:hypothetical protein [Actinomycetota bacterium]
MEWNQSGLNCVKKMPALAPTITGFTPGSGKTRTLITINGTHLEQAALKMGLSPMFVADNRATQIKAYAWDWNTSGKIRVTNAGGTTLSLGTFIVSFGVSSFSPSSGPFGTSVVIHGSGFNASSVVKFNGSTASRTVNSSTQITAIVPLFASTGKISVTNTSGVLGTVYSWGTFTKT